MPGWVDAQSVVDVEVIGDQEETAQVHPFKYTNAMVDFAVENGAHLVRDKVVDLVCDIVFS